VAGSWATKPATRYEFDFVGMLTSTVMLNAASPGLCMPKTFHVRATGESSAD